jgi:hypothetical protein
MLVDRIRCRLDSLALERENGIIDTLLCIHVRVFIHSDRSREEEQRQRACEELHVQSLN